MVVVDGVHDLGGRDGFGLVEVEQNEPVFHEAWEGHVFALAGALMTHGLFGTPEFRYAIERMRPDHYLAASYYERWLTALASLVVEKNVLGHDQLRQSVAEDFPLSGRMRVPRGGPPGPDVTEARFRVGDGVRVRNMHPRGHTRCPGYVRGRRGTVVRYDGPCNFDDVEAHCDAARLEPLYCVQFDAVELWGDDAEANAAVHVDLFEAYLEVA
jgi:nitrile hydratase beta subunit